MRRMRPLSERLREDMISARVVIFCLSDDQRYSMLEEFRGRVKPRIEREVEVGGELGIVGKDRGGEQKGHLAAHLEELGKKNQVNY